jgi:putative transposase
MLTSPKYEPWPIISIAAQGLRNGEVMASLYSWYKYAKILNLSHKSCKKTTKQAVLNALKPNEYLHIDTTYYPVSGAGKACITIVMENFSKMILGFAVEERLSFTLIQSAIKRALIPIIQQQGGAHSYLVSDGGWENNSQAINQFITGLKEYRLSKITALKDIQFSNSPVEAIHKIIKGRYLRNKVFETVQGLSNFLKDAIYDYNYVRPHYKHFPKTPAEVYFNTDLKINLKNGY